MNNIKSDSRPPGKEDFAALASEWIWSHDKGYRLYKQMGDNPDGDNKWIYIKTSCHYSWMSSCWDCI